jgi:H+-transporting ATPase
VLGEYVEAAVIAALLTFNAALGFFQENRAQATLDALKSRLALVTPVRRDGAWRTVPVAQLVPGDIVKLSLGCIVGADVRLLEGEVLLDQSTLTGESLPIEGGPGLQTYAGALVRRGEAVAEVTATGGRTKFGRTAELVRIAHVTSSQQQAVMRVVRNLAMFNGVVVLIQIGYASSLHMPLFEIVPLALTAILAAIPVALPATFTLATALGARVLAKLGVLPTRLSSIDEAASMDVLCADKTGTLTRNELAVAAVRAMAGFDEAHVLGLAALASSEGGQDPVDAAIRKASRGASMPDLPKLVRFVPFDPANKMSEALASDTDDRAIRIVKGAFERVSALTKASRAASVAAQALAAKGFRVLAVAVGAPDALDLAGLIALSDPPRADSARLIADLLGMGVHTVMVTGDAVATASVVAHAVGLDGAVCPPGPPPGPLRAEDYAVFAGVFPEDKFRIIKAFQSGGHIVGMCGDGANDAPALRQAQMGIAVSTATDVAKSAAGIVLTEPGLGGIVTAVREGRVTFQRILTYMLRSVTRKIDQMLFLTVGLIMTGHAILTPMLMVVLMTTGDFLAMSSTTDNVRPSQKPNAWQINHVTIAGIVLACCNLLFCSALLAVGKFWLAFGTGQLQTLAVVILAFSGQAVLYVVRERRRLWSSCPGRWLVLSSVVDVSLIATLATRGILMSSVPLLWVGAVLGATVVFAFVLDLVKVAIFGRLRMT